MLWSYTIGFFLSEFLYSGRGGCRNSSVPPPPTYQDWNWREEYTIVSNANSLYVY